MQVFSTIIPIFAVVILGFIARKKGFMPPEFLGPANRMVYYLAMPALIFRAVAKASFVTEFNGIVLVVMLSTTSIGYLGAWICSRFTHWPPSRIGSFIQCSAHGNPGYIGIPVAFYFLGSSGLVKASILAGFLMLLHNIMSVLVLESHSQEEAKNRGHKFRNIAQKLVHNPVIMAVTAGMVVSLFRIPLPEVLHRFLDILSGLAPPMALLLIGASLSIQVMRKNIVSVMGAVVIKLMGLPLTGLAAFTLLGIPVDQYLPALILLATPTATISYVMAKEMGGDDEFAVAAISTSTFISAFTYLIWLNAAG